MQKLKFILLFMYSMAFFLNNVNGDEKAAVAVTTNEKPTVKEIITLIMSNHHLPLTVHPSCQGVGTEFSDKTVGDYISGFLAAFADSSGTNWLDVQTEPVKDGWKVNFIIRKSNGEEEWGWGICFIIDSRKQSLQKGTLMCIGGG